MMSLSKMSAVTVVKKQYMYKLKANIDVFISLMLLQLLALLFSLNGSGSMGTGSGDDRINVTFYSADIVIFFMIVWGFISAMLMTTKAYRNDDFLYVSNRLSSHLSNGLFILTASIIAGVTAILSSFLLKVVVTFKDEMIYTGGVSLLDAPEEMLLGIVATSLYILLFSSSGYFIGMLVQVSRVFILVLPALFIGDILFNASNGEGFIVPFFGDFFTESSFLLFIFKILLTTGLLFIASIFLSKRMEVR